MSEDVLDFLAVLEEKFNESVEGQELDEEAYSAAEILRAQPQRWPS